MDFSAEQIVSSGMYASNTLTLLVGRQEGHPACKNPDWFYLSGTGPPG